ncbi:MAG: glycosyltransferase [Candidatus Eisenbacteria sp.]|nr:glycosyltransferase [Candidatus Eisenbacteria bacterium]
MTGAPGSRTPVVVLGATPWHAQWRRRQHLFSQLARLRPVYHLDPPVPPRHLGRGTVMLSSRAAVREGCRRDPSGVRVLSGPLGFPGERFASGMRRLNARMQRHWIARCLCLLSRQQGVRRPILVCYDALLHPLPGEGVVAQRLFDLIDDYPARTPQCALRTVLEHRTQALAAASDLTLVTNDHLAARVRASARRIEYLPHGVDPDCFHPQADRGTSFAPLRTLPGIKAVYHGTLDQKLDEEILTALLQAGITLLLAGERAWSARTLARLRRAGDLRDFGALDRSRAAALVAAADVGILPYRAFAGCEGAEVLKRLEFFAAGLPVVASDIPPCRRHAEELILAAGPADFVAGVRRAATEATSDASSELPGEVPGKDGGRERRLAIARRNTWEQRARELDGWLVP